MNTIFSYWSLSWWAVIALIMVVGSVAVYSKAPLKNIYFIVAVMLLLICLFSPLQVLSSAYLFSAHMTVHVTLLLLVGPLLLLSLSPGNHSFPLFFMFLKKYPIAGWLSGTGLMWFWHIPVIFNNSMAAMHGEASAITSLTETISLIAAGILFSAPVLHPNKRFTIDPLSGVVYLFTACIACSVLGLLITFAPAGTYHHYLLMYDDLVLNNIITANWGMTALKDQQAAGLIMWVPCCLIYVCGAMYLLIKWFKEKEDESLQLKHTI